MRDVPRWRKPLVVAAVLAIAGIVGATSIYFVARAAHRRDRGTILEFDRARLPIVEGAIEDHRNLYAIVQASLVTREPPAASDLSSLRASIERARRDLLRDRIEDILMLTMSDFLSGIGSSLEALTLAQRWANSGTARFADEKEYRRAWDEAQKRFDSGRRRLERLHHRAQLPVAFTA